MRLQDLPNAQKLEPRAPLLQPVPLGAAAVEVDDFLRRLRCHRSHLDAQPVSLYVQATRNP